MNSTRSVLSFVLLFRKTRLTPNSPPGRQVKRERNSKQGQISHILRCRYREQSFQGPLTHTGMCWDPHISFPGKKSAFPALPGGRKSRLDSKPRPAACCPHLCVAPQRRAVTPQPRRPQGPANASLGKRHLLWRHLGISGAPAWKFPSMNSN